MWRRWCASLSLDDIKIFIRCLDIPFIVHGIKMSWVCPVLIRKQVCDHYGYIAMGVSLWVCLYWGMWVCVGSGAMNLAVRSHMFAQSEQVGYEYCWIWYRLIKV